MKKTSIVPMIVICAMLLGLLSACAGKQADNAATSDSTQAKATLGLGSQETAELTFFAEIYSEDVFKDIIEAPLKEKFPNVTFKYIQRGQGTKIEDLIAAGEIPDIVFFNNFYFKSYRNLGLNMDLNPLIKKYNLDTSKLYPTVIPSLQAYGMGEVPALPVFLSSGVTIYNKDIFDKFGVPYPKDEMTWDDAYDLARKTTRESDGTQYIGMGLDANLMFNANQLSLGYIDPKTNKANVNNEQWKQAFQNFKRLIDFPGVSFTDKTVLNVGNLFTKDKTVAMRVGHDQIFVLEDAAKNGLNFDYATLPSYPQLPGTGEQLIMPSLEISKTSKHQDLSFQILAYLLSDEVQMRNSRKGYQSALQDPKVNATFCAELSWMNGKNVQALIKHKIAPSAPRADYDITVVNKVLQQAFVDVALNSVDVNSALRQADDGINKLIKEANN